jgi:hypothetical protein
MHWDLGIFRAICFSAEGLAFGPAIGTCFLVGHLLFSLCFSVPAEDPIPPSSRRSSARSIAASVNPANSDSTLSNTTRLAFIVRTAWLRRMNRPSRLYSPVSAVSFRSMRTWSTNSFLPLTSPLKLRPSDRTLAASFSVVSSNSMADPVFAVLKGAVRQKFHGESCRNLRYRTPAWSGPSAALRL